MVWREGTDAAGMPLSLMVVRGLMQRWPSVQVVCECYVPIV